MTNHSRVVGTILVFLATLPATAGAQTSAEKLLGSIEDAGVAWLWPKNLNAGIKARSGYALEFTFMVKSVGDSPNDSTLRARCAEKAKAPGVTCTGKAAFSRTITTVRTFAGGSDTTWTVTPVDLSETWLNIAFTVSTRHTEIRDGNVPNWRLSGRVQEFPTLTGFFTFFPRWHVSPYLGATLTPAELKGLKLVREDTVVAGDGGQTVGGAVSGGLVHEIMKSGISVFVQGEYSWLKFRGVSWARPADVLTGIALPRDVDMSGPRVSVGLQTAIPKKK